MSQNTQSVRRHRAALIIAAAVVWLGFLPARSARAIPCVGDCDGDGTVSINELVMMVSMALGTVDMSACHSDPNGDGMISVNELVSSTLSALDGCEAGPTPTPTPDGNQCGTFNSTFEAIQKVVFEKRGCTSTLCHGTANFPQGELNLLPDVAFSNIFEVKSFESELPRIQPGDKDRSYLWLKLAAATDPSQLPPGFTISGAPMPNGLPPLTKDELEAMRLWIYAGASLTGTVSGTDKLLNACLPPPEPILIEPLAAPTPGTGVQFTMPPWPLEAHSEHEICFATYYDITDQVPEEFKDPSGTMFRFSSSELRQDPQSHHLILNRYFGDISKIHDPSLGQWTCNGGDRAGETCEPTDTASCGTGICTSAIKQSFACIGFGPRGSGQQYYSIGGAQAAQSHSEYVSGVFAQIPLKGMLYWNSHAFNLTDKDTIMHAWLNYYFAQDQQFPVQPIFNVSKIFSANAAPFTTQTICNDHVLPKGARLFNLSSHTHKHGKHFTVQMPDGSTIYENFIYNDPADITYDPPIAFDSDDPAQRTLHYCSLYNNGVKGDGSPDVDLVTRHSLVPASAEAIGQCRPVACVAGKIGAACNGVGDDRTCDSASGANDGLCDACPITGGESTQNEMFILIGSYYLDHNGTASAQSAAVLNPVRSESTELVLPAQVGCSSSPGGHEGHTGH